MRNKFGTNKYGQFIMAPTDDGTSGAGGYTPPDPSGEGMGDPNDEGQQGGSGGLPSGQANPDDLEKFKGFDEKHIKDGKLFGKFESVEDYVTSSQNLEKEFHKRNRNPEGGEGAPPAGKTDADKNAVVAKFAKEYFENGQTLTDEMKAEAEAVGLHPAEIELGAIKVNTRIESGYKVVGGKEEYESMMAWGGENLTEEQKRDFDKGLTSGVSQYAIQGLHAEYRQAVQNGHAPRVRGDNGGQNTGAQGYETRKEYLDDKAYLQREGRNDREAHKAFKARLAKTSDSVLGIR